MSDGQPKVTTVSRRGFLATGAGASSAMLGAAGSETKPAVAGDTATPDAPMKAEATITLVQLTDNGDAASVVARMPKFFQEAKAAGSDLIVFPEYVLGNRIPIDHANVQTFRALAKEHGIYAIAGMVEASGDQWATTALMVDRQGTLLGRYLKTHPASGPGPHWWPPIEGHDSEARGILGGEFKVFHLDFGPISILQCYDGYFPEAWACTSYAGAEIILWINGRPGQIEDFFALSAATAHGCVVGANITNGKNTGFAGPFGSCVKAEGEREPMRMFPRIKEVGDACVHATIDLAKLRWQRKHLRTMHQRRPDLYGPLTKDVTMWKEYPDIPWDYPECKDLVNKAQL